MDYALTVQHAERCARWCSHVIHVSTPTPELGQFSRDQVANCTDSPNKHTGPEFTEFT